MSLINLNFSSVVIVGTVLSLVSETNESLWYSLAYCVYKFSNFSHDFLALIFPSHLLILAFEDQFQHTHDIILFSTLSGKILNGHELFYVVPRLARNRTELIVACMFIMAFLLYKCVPEILDNFYITVYWAVILACCTGLQLCICYFSKQKHETTINLKRKVFHLASVLLFYPAIRQNVHFMKICSECALLIFMFIERVYEAGYSKKLNEGIDRFARKDDDSHLSPLFLLIGMTSPLYFSGEGVFGLITLGFGDVAGSIIGIAFGARFLPVSYLSYEGYIAEIIANIVASRLFMGSLQFYACICVSALDLFYHDINDNLFSPIAMLAATRVFYGGRAV